MEVVAICPSRIEAEIIVGKLKSFGIDALIKCDDEGGLHPGMALASGAEVLVPSEKKDEALQILEQD